MTHDIVEFIELYEVVSSGGAEVLARQNELEYAEAFVRAYQASCVRPIAIRKTRWQRVEPEAHEVRAMPSGELLYEGPAPYAYAEQFTAHETAKPIGVTALVVELAEPKPVDLVVVERPEGWEPKDWGDDLPDAEPIGIEARAALRAESEGLRFGFNAASMAKDGSVWLVERPCGSCDHLALDAE